MASIFEATAGKLIGPTTGGTVTQATNKTTGVTLNAASGQITMNGAELAGAAEATFTVTNSEISSTSNSSRASSRQGCRARLTAMMQHRPSGK